MMLLLLKGYKTVVNFLNAMKKFKIIINGFGIFNRRS
jgi:hypothetical protein